MSKGRSKPPGRARERAPDPERAATPSESKPGGPREWPWWVAPLVAGLALRVWLGLYTSGLTMDSPLYVEMSEALARGDRQILGPAHHGYPALIALASRVLPGRELPARLVSLLAGLALIPIVYALARRRLAAAWASFAATLVALHPLLAIYSGAIMTETCFFAALYGGLLLLERSRPAAGGALLGVSYWLRPEALVVGPLAPPLARLERRFVAVALLAFLLAMIPQLLLLRWQYGVWTPTPKTLLVRPSLEGGHETEWHVADARAATPSALSPAALGEWASSAARHYLPNLRDHGSALLVAWPWPLLALSLAGLVTRRGALVAPLVCLLVLPLLAVVPHERFGMVLEPALAVFAAAGAAAIAAARPSRAWAGVVAGAALLLAGVGLGQAWRGRPGDHALYFDDGPIEHLRAAGLWLRAEGKPGALVMDRKPYVPFYAGMRHAQLPDDPYDTVVEWARASGADYLVIEEYVAVTLRPQLLPLVADSAFAASERRLRPVYGRRDWKGTGVWIYEVVREPGSASRPAARP